MAGSGSVRIENCGTSRLQSGSVPGASCRAQHDSDTRSSKTWCCNLVSTGELDCLCRTGLLHTDTQSGHTRTHTCTTHARTDCWDRAPPCTWADRSCYLLLHCRNASETALAMVKRTERRKTCDARCLGRGFRWRDPKEKRTETARAVAKLDRKRTWVRRGHIGQRTRFLHGALEVSSRDEALDKEIRGRHLLVTTRTLSQHMLTRGRHLTQKYRAPSSTNTLRRNQSHCLCCQNGQQPRSLSAVRAELRSS